MLRASLTAAALVLLAWPAGGLAQPASGPTAHAARSLQVNDRGRLRFGSDSATTIFDRGSLSGTLPGQASVAFTYNGSPNVTARFAIHAGSGSIFGQARCTLHDPASPTPSFKGALQITGGSGRYARARGSGELYGVFYRRGYGLSVQATGALRY